MTPERFIFGVHSLHHLRRHREMLETFHFHCTVEVETYCGFELHILVATPPKKENPIQFTRAI